MNEWINDIIIDDSDPLAELIAEVNGVTRERQEKREAREQRIKAAKKRLAADL
jgi:hypothetical protein